LFSALFCSLFVSLVWAHSTARNAVAKERLFAVVDCINTFEQWCSENALPFLAPSFVSLVRGEASNECI